MTGPRQHGIWVMSTRDIRDKIGRTQLSFDAYTGGMPVRILIALLGAGVAMLSVTGVVIWLKKRRAAQGASKRLPAGQEKAQRP